MDHLSNTNASYSTASSSTDASSNTNLISAYDIFINHRGPDVKKTLASHLYYRLHSHGFRVFLDRQEMQVGEELTPQIKGAIATASIHIAIFSPGYAESRWCLDELVLMLMRKSEATIIPVFYKVKPSDLRIRTHEGEDAGLGQILRFLGWRGDNGVYDKALRVHEKKRRYDPQIIANWRTALCEVSDISGFDLEEAYNGDEGELADKLVQQVEQKVRKSPLDVTTYATGLDEKLEDFEETVLLQHRRHSRKVKVAGILGPGGVGKTTLAVEFFKRSDYNRSCFLMDVRVTSLVSLQSKLMQGLNVSFEAKLDDIADGNRVEALVILDDVDDAGQLDALFSLLENVLSFQSLILVTSRSKDVLSRIGEPFIYKLAGLDREHSRELFCLHAFHKHLPDVGFEELVTKFLNVCDGLPLSVKVLGSLLYEKKSRYWEAQLRKIGDVLPMGIQSRLKISYDSLDWQEKEIFLDIACFFIGENRDTAIRIWDASGWEGWLNLENLQNKCLVEIDSKNCIKMHDHLRDLGRDLAEKDLSRCYNRLWRPDNPFHNTPGQSIVRGINMVEGRSGLSSDNPVGFDKLQLLKAEGDCLESISNQLQTQSNLLWLRWENNPYPSLPSWIPTKKLRVLQVVGGKLETLWQSENEAPLLLRELNIGAALRVPRSIGLLKYLEKIEMEDIREPLPEEFFNLSSLKHLRLRTGMMLLPHTIGNLTKLQHIDLSGCMDLQTLPSSLGNIASLEHIILNECEGLQNLPDSFGSLKRLKHLSLAGCKNLTISCKTFGDISELESLDLSHCVQMEVLPPQVTNQLSLKEINLLHTNFRDMPKDIGNLRKLKILKLECRLLEMLPPSFDNLRSLMELRLDFCNNLKSLPDSIAELKQLTKLMIAHAGIEHLPVGVTQLNNLEILSVRYCPLSEMPFASVGKVGPGVKEAFADLKGLKILGSSIDKCMCMLRLKHLDMRGTAIKELSFSQGVCPNLQHLNISFCDRLVEVGALPTKLISLHLQECCALQKIRGLSGLVKLRLLDIRGSTEIEEIPGLECLTSLEELRGAYDSEKIQKSVRKWARATIEKNRNTES